MTDQGTVWLTQEAYDKLQAELEDLKGPKRQEIIEKIAAARDEGDLKENSGYHAAKDDQGKQEARIRQLEDMLRKAEVGETPPNDGVVEPGMVVTVRIDGGDRRSSSSARARTSPRATPSTSTRRSPPWAPRSTARARATRSPTPRPTARSSPSRSSTRSPTRPEPHLITAGAVESTAAPRRAEPGVHSPLARHLRAYDAQCRRGSRARAAGPSGARRAPRRGSRAGCGPRPR